MDSSKYWETKNIKVEEAKGSWLTDLAWSQVVGSPTEMIAVSCQNGKVIVFKKNNGVWEQSGKTIETNKSAWKLNWSPCGGLLAVCCGENETKIYKEDGFNEWQEM